MTFSYSVICYLITNLFFFQFKDGRLLWDFLQQLLNDHQQRYSNYIAWKCRDTGVFKIVDPAGLAKVKILLLTLSLVIIQFICKFAPNSVQYNVLLYDNINSACQ